MSCCCRQWSPEQVSGHLRRQGFLAISHETIYRHSWRDKRAGGLLYTHLRGARKQRRKRYGSIEARPKTLFYFARPYHSWERGSNENANGLIRQYLPKGTSMAALSQPQCNAIARTLNTRPRKQLGLRTPLECYYES